MSFQYSNKVSSPSAASTSPVIAKPADSAILKTKAVVITTKLQPEITATSDTLAPPSLTKNRLLSEDKQWHELKIDYSKLTQHYLMLSKIRLTCRYYNW